MTLKKQILGLIALALLISIAVASVLTYWHAHKKVAVEMDAALSVGQSAVRDAVEPLAKYNEPARQIQRIVEGFNGDRHLQAFWVGPAGTVVAESALRTPEDAVPLWFYEIFAGRQREARIDLPAKMSDLGYIRLATDSHSEVSEVWDDLSLKALIVAAFAILVLTLVNSALAHALRPLNTLSEALHRVGRGDYEANVPVSGPLEFSNIYASFNTMAARLFDMERQNARLNNQLATVQEEERADIARDLHDEFGPFLFSIDVDARAIRKEHDTGGGSGVGTGADSIRNSVAHLQRHLKSILGRLRPTALLDLGLSHALDHLVEFWSGRHPEIRIMLAIDQTSYGQRADDICYRVVQESINNAVRHGKPTEIEIGVSAERPGTLVATVTDNGGGSVERKSGGFGLVGMRERVAAAGGRIELGNRGDARGFRVVAEIPIELDGDGGVTLGDAIMEREFEKASHEDFDR